MINLLIRPRDIASLRTGQILFQEDTETFYTVREIGSNYAELVPFESREYNSVLSNLKMYVNSKSVQDYIILPRV